MSYSRNLIMLGPAGSFSDIAATRLGASFKKCYVTSFAKLFAKLKDKNHYGLVPVRNKIVGKIFEVSHFMKKKKFKEIHTFKMRVTFVLAAKKGVTPQNIRRIYCPLVVKQQCFKFLGKNLPKANFSLNFDSSSAAYKKIVQLKNFSAAAIGSEYGAKLYGLKVLARNIQDDPDDWTEFVVVRRYEYDL